jgi:hypothetical protein
MCEQAMRFAWNTLLGGAIVAAASCGAYRGVAEGEPAQASDTNSHAVDTAAAESDISADEHVVFYRTSAYLDASGEEWSVPLRGIIYEPEANSWWRKWLVEEIAEELSLPEGSEEARNLQVRLRLFMVDNERRETIAVRMGDQVLSAGTSQPNGHFRNVVRLDRRDGGEGLTAAGPGDADRLTYIAVTPLVGRAAVCRGGALGRTAGALGDLRYRRYDQAE